MLLTRSGNSVPLDIEINMKGDFMYDIWFQDGQCAKRARNALEFIVAQGGVTSRWETLVVWSDMPDVILAVMNFVHNARLDILRTLELHNKTYKLLGGDELVTDLLPEQASSRSVMFKTQPALLRHIELLGIPPNFLLQRGPIPLVCNLTLLRLMIIGTLPHLVGLRELFIRSPRLETLVLYTYKIDSPDFQSQPPTAIRVYMPHLRQFTHHQWDSVSWGLSVLKMVDAPNVEVFSLSSTFIEGSDTIISYLAFGRRGGRLVDDHSTLDERINGASIYPTLKHLTIGGAWCSLGVLSNMLKAFQGVTRLDWEMRVDLHSHLIGLLSDGTICPQLEHLRVHLVSDVLMSVVHQRAKQGRPLKVVEASSFFWDNIPTETKRELKGALERFEPYGDLSYCSHANEDEDIRDSTTDDNVEGSRLVEHSSL